MNPHLALVGGAVIGLAASAVMVPVTRHQLAAAVARSDAAPVEGSASRLVGWQWAALVITSGILTGIVWRGVGGSLTAVPPLVLLLGLIQLAYCDATRRLLPKPLVYGLTLAVVASGVAVAWHLHQWQRFEQASIGALAFFAVLFIMNLLNPRWMAFGDVRLSLVAGFGLSWIGVSALIEGFFIANVLAAVIGLTLIVLRRASRKSALPFGLYLALGTSITILAWT